MAGKMVRSDSGPGVAIIYTDEGIFKMVVENLMVPELNEASPEDIKNMGNSIPILDSGKINDWKPFPKILAICYQCVVRGMVIENINMAFMDIGKGAVKFQEGFAIRTKSCLSPADNGNWLKNYLLTKDERFFKTIALKKEMIGLFHPIIQVILKEVMQQKLNT